MTALVLASAAVLTAPGPALLDLRVTNGSAPYLGDRRLLTTVSPNRDGFRDEAVVHFRLVRPATVGLEIVATNMVRAGRGGTTIVWKTTRHFDAGAGALTWRPAPSTQPRTYVLRLKVGGRVYGGAGPSRRQNAPVVRVQGIDAAFTSQNGEQATGKGPSVIGATIVSWLNADAGRAKSKAAKVRMQLRIIAMSFGRIPHKV